MKTFPDNRLSHFTTLLPQQLNFEGKWEVALVEIAWPSSILNITAGTFNYKLMLDADDDDDCKDANQKRRKRPYGLVSMYKPHSPLATDQPFEEMNGSIKPGVYSTVDQIMKAICKKIFKNGDETALTWKIDEPSQKLKVYYEGSKRDILSLKASSVDLQNVLGIRTMVDYPQSGSSNEPLRSKVVGEFPVDLSGGCNTIFLYCDLVQNEILGDSQTALLRAIPLDANQTKNGSHQRQNYQTFGNLQWRRIVKSSLESITISLRNESGQLIPFLSRGRTNITLQFRKCQEK